MTLSKIEHDVSYYEDSSKKDYSFLLQQDAYNFSLCFNDLIKNSDLKDIREIIIKSGGVPLPSDIGYIFITNVNDYDLLDFIHNGSEFYLVEISDYGFSTDFIIESKISPEDLKNKIKSLCLDKNNKIAKLKKEISSYEQDILSLLKTDIDKLVQKRMVSLKNKSVKYLNDYQAKEIKKEDEKINTSVKKVVDNKKDKTTCLNDTLNLNLFLNNLDYLTVNEYQNIFYSSSDEYLLD